MKVLNCMVICIAAMIILSCSKKVSTYEQTVENGIRVTKNNGIPADSTFKIELKEVGFIDMENETDTMKYIGFPQSFDFDSEGNFYILDYRSAIIHKYDHGMKQTAVFGGKGQGPGEFQNAAKMLIRNDTIFVPDAWSWCVNKLDLTGQFITNKQYDDYEKAPADICRFGPKYVSRFLGNTSEEGVIYGLTILSLFGEGLDYEKEFYKSKRKIDYSVEYDPSANGTVYTANDTELYLYINSKTDYKIDVYDLDGNKKRAIKKTYARLKNSEENIKKQQEMAEKNGMKYKTEFRNSIYRMHADKYGRLWVSSSTLKEEKGSYFDIFKDDIFINRVKIGIDEGYYITLVGEKILAINGNGNIKIFEY